MNSSKIVRTADLPLSIVVRVLESLNRGKIILVTYGDDITIVTDTNPRQFNFPEGWYFSMVCSLINSMPHGITVKLK